MKNTTKPKTQNPKAENRPPPSAPPPREPQPPPPPPASFIYRLSQWFVSKTVRQATAMRKHVHKLLQHQRDILSAQAIQNVQAAVAALQDTVARGADKSALEAQMENLEKVANQWIKPYPNPVWRENIEVLLVALTVAMGVRTFFLQPFKIPTGSMQPTLFGVVSTPDFSREFDVDDSVARLAASELKISSGWERVREWFSGVSYVQVTAKVDGELERVNPPLRLLIFNILQTLQIGGRTHIMLFPPDFGGTTLEKRAGLKLGTLYKQGDEVVRMKVISGDHLFVDRITYNFRAPKRGEIIVFETRGIDELPQDQFYIKRMVAMGAERVQIGDDRHLIINGHRLDASTPHFENVYSFDPNDPPRESRYSGHLNQKVAEQYHLGYLAPRFRDANSVYTVADDHYMVMGDNTANSYDSRSWGDFPASNVIGKSFFIYWPISERFGWGAR